MSNFNPDSEEDPWERAERGEEENLSEEMMAEFLYQLQKDREIEDYFNKQERG